MKKIYLQPEAEVVNFAVENICDMELTSTETENGGGIGDPTDAGEDLIRQFLPENDATNALTKMFDFGIFN